nr:spore germination protein GerW family protein [Nocardia wallacei]
MKVEDVLATARDAITVKRVFAEPIERDGTTVIAAATVSGGAGGGSGTDSEGQEGSGAGFGVGAKPAGAYVLQHGHLRWQPAVDVNRLVTMITVIAVTALAAAVCIARLRATR